MTVAWSSYINPADYIESPSDAPNVGDVPRVVTADPLALEWQPPSASLTVQEDDVTVSSSVTTIDFGNGLDVTESPAGEVNVVVDLGEYTGSDLPVSGGGTGASDASTARSNLGLGTIATQSAASVAITGGSITGITDLALADGGTGASTAADARTNLELGTIATQSAASVSITGGSITGITDLAVADGGTGASTAPAARDNLGLFRRGFPSGSVDTTIVALPGVAHVSESVLTVTTNRRYYFPFLVDYAITVDALVCEVTTAAGTVARLGIYNANTSWQPTTLVQDAGTINPSTTGVKTASFTAVTLQPGRYLATITVDAAAGLRVIRGNLPLGRVASYLGTAPMPSLFYVSANTNALPASGTAWGSWMDNTVPFMNLCWLRVTGEA